MRKFDFTIGKICAMQACRIKYIRGVDTSNVDAVYDGQVGNHARIASHGDCSLFHF